MGKPDFASEQSVRVILKLMLRSTFKDGTALSLSNVYYLNDFFLQILHINDRPLTIASTHVKIY